MHAELSLPVTDLMAIGCADFDMFKNHILSLTYAYILASNYTVYHGLRRLNGLFVGYSLSKLKQIISDSVLPECLIKVIREFARPMMFAKRLYIPNPDELMFLSQLTVVNNTDRIINIYAFIGDIGPVNNEVPDLYYRPRLAHYLNRYFSSRFKTVNSLTVETLEPSGMFYCEPLQYISDVANDEQLIYCFALKKNFIVMNNTSWPLDNWCEPPIFANCINTLELVSHREALSGKVDAATNRLISSLDGVKPSGMQHPAPGAGRSKPARKPRKKPPDRSAQLQDPDLLKEKK